MTIYFLESMVLDKRIAVFETLKVSLESRSLHAILGAASQSGYQVTYPNPIKSPFENKVVDAAVGALNATGYSVPRSSLHIRAIVEVSQ